MKKFIINKCMNYIKKYNDYDEIKLKEIEYGLVSIYLTLYKLIIILIISLLLGVFKEVLIFMLLFNIIRTTAFGLHATKSWICLVSSTIMFIGIPILCKYLNINIYLKVIICILNIILIFKNAPADTYKRPIVNKKRRLIYKTISTLTVIIFSFFAILINNNFICNCLIFSSILENCLISPYIYKLFKLPYNNYITFLEKHPDFLNNSV